MFALPTILLAAAAVLPAPPFPGPNGQVPSRPVAAGQAAGPASARATVRLPLPPPGRRLLLPHVAGPADPRLPLVVIDPGHGGVDQGAIAPDGGDEKTLALDLARALRDELVAGGRVRVALTRDGDRLLTLEERAAIAARLRADLFVSIHLAPPAAGPQGLSVTTAAIDPSDPLAGRAAARENAADSRPRGPALGRRPAAADWKGAPLTARQSSERSVVFANLVLRESRGGLALQPRPRREAPLDLLAAVAAPAVLVEAGALGAGATGGERDGALATASGRASFARSLARAIATFFARLPPER